MFTDSLDFDLLSDGSNREMITENRMAIKNCPLTEATVNEYLGKEIKGWKEAGLNPEERYKVYRPLEELEKSLFQYNGMDVVDDHHPMYGLKDNRKYAIGATGESATIDGHKVLNTIFITDKNAIRDIEMATKSRGQFGKRCLSCSYDYTPIFEKGVFQNKPYDIKIKDLKLDHIALVQEGRVQGAQIADSNHILKGINYMREFMKSALKGIFGIETINDSQIEQVMLLNDKHAAKEHNKYHEEKDCMDNEQHEKDKEELARIKKMKKHEEEELEGEEYPEDKKHEDRMKDKEHEEHKDEEDEDYADDKKNRKHHNKAIKDAVATELKEIRNIQILCSKAIGGALSDSALELDKEVLLHDTLTKLGHEVEDKSYDIQKIMLETLIKANIGINKNNKYHNNIHDSKNTNDKSVYTMDNIKKLIGSKQ